MKSIFDAKAFLFDMDGTIVNNCAYHVLAWQAFSEKLGNKLSKEDILAWMGATNQVYQERILNRKVTPEESIRFSNEKESLYQKLYKPHIALAPGLRELLNQAHKLNIQCAIVSGAPRINIDFVFDALNLHSDFPLVVDASSYTHGKPDPECYLVAANKLGVDPKDCVVFEDATNGVESALAANMQCVAITQTISRSTLEKYNLMKLIDTFFDLLN